MVIFDKLHIVLAQHMASVYRSGRCHVVPWHCHLYLRIRSLRWAAGTGGRPGGGCTDTWRGSALARPASGTSCSGGWRSCPCRHSAQTAPADALARTLASPSVVSVATSSHTAASLGQQGPANTVGNSQADRKQSGMFMVPGWRWAGHFTPPR